MRTLLLGLALFATSALAQQWTCTTIGHQTHCDATVNGKRVSCTTTCIDNICTTDCR